MTKLAKCNINTLSFCRTKHDSPQCDECIFVKRRDPYKWVNGQKLKKCPRCGEYKTLDEFRLTSDSSGRKYRSWCKKCMNEYCRAYSAHSRKHYMIGHKENGKKTFIKVDSPAKMLKLVRKYIVEGNEIIIEIKRVH